MSNSLQQLLGRAGRKVLERTLPRSVVTHDSIDDLELGNYLEDSEQFRRITVDDAPIVPPAMEEPPAPDFTTASPEEIKAWQAEAKKVEEARLAAPPYSAWPDLTGDIFRAYHTHDEPEVINEVDPGVALHPRIVPKLLSQDEFAESRIITRDDPTLAAMATMAATKAMREVLTDELKEQAQQQEEFEKLRKEAEERQGELEALREEARTHHDKGEGIPQPLVQQIKQKVQEQRALFPILEQLAQPKPMGTEAMQAIAGAAQAGQAAAEAAKGVPSFGAGIGAGEPVYTSPEQALSIAERWANDPDLRQMAQLFGRLDKDIRFKRSKRVVGGNDEIVDVKFGDNISRLLPSELALLSDDDTEDDFWARYCSQELLEFSTVGEEHAGRGPILIVLDGSSSMHGDRNVWARAVAMCLLHIARLEHRDFGCVEFSSGGQVADWIFRAKIPMDAEQVIDMASHMFGGGTSPIIGIDRAAQVMKEAPAFSKADLVIVGDGDAGFGPEDEKLRDSLTELGVRLFGIAIGGEFNPGNNYLTNYCEYVVDVHDFQLTDPGDATAALATHIT